MNSQTYKQSLEQAKRDLAAAVRERNRWNLEIMRLQNLVRALAISSVNAEKAERLAAEWQVFITITQAIEALVNASPNGLTPIEAREELLAYGYDIGRYANPMAMIHQTLKRLAAEGRIVPGGAKYFPPQIYQGYVKGR